MMERKEEMRGTERTNDIRGRRLMDLQTMDVRMRQEED